MRRPRAVRRCDFFRSVLPGPKARRPGQGQGLAGKTGTPTASRKSLPLEASGRSLSFGGDRLTSLDHNHGPFRDGAKQGVHVENCRTAATSKPNGRGGRQGGPLRGSPALHAVRCQEIYTRVFEVRRRPGGGCASATGWFAVGNPLRVSLLFLFGGTVGRRPFSLSSDCGRDIRNGP